MKKISVSVSYDEERLSTLRLYLEQKGMQVEDELTKSLDTLYANGIHVFLATPSGARPAWMSQKYPEVLRVSLPLRRCGGRKRSRNLPRR